MFAEDYARYIYLLNTVNAPGFDGAANLNLVQELPVYVQKMDGYASQGLVVLDLSRDIYVPTGSSGVTVPPDQLPPVINPGIQSPYNPGTGSTAPGNPTTTPPDVPTPATDYVTYALIAAGVFIAWRLLK